MKKRLLSAILSLCMVCTMLPAMALTAGAADDGATNLESWSEAVSRLSPGQSYALPLSGTTTIDSAEDTIFVRKGVTLTVSGDKTDGATITGSATPFIVEDGGHLILNNLTITNVNGTTGVTNEDGTLDANGASGAVYVKKGGTLELGVYSENGKAPTITGNTVNNNARNLVIEDGATVLLNGDLTGDIGVFYNEDMTNFSPKALIQGGIKAIPHDVTTDNHKIFSDNIDYNFTLANDYLVLQSSTVKILYWSPICYWHVTGRYSHMEDDPLNILTDMGFHVDYLKGSCSSPSGSWKRNDIVPVTKAHLTDKLDENDTEAVIDKLNTYDLIHIGMPYEECTEEEYNALKKYLNNGGRIIIQGENSYPGTQENWQEFNVIGSAIAQELGAKFKADQTYYIKYGDPVTIGKAPLAKKLTQGIQESELSNGMSSPIELMDDTAVGILWSKDNVGHNVPWMVAQPAGNNENGEKWGSIIYITDGNYWLTMPTATRKLYYNIMDVTRQDRVFAATSVDPNAINLRVTGSTAYTLTFEGLHRGTYTVTKCTKDGDKTGNDPISDEDIWEVDDNGTFRVKNLEKGQYYLIEDEFGNFVVGRTSLVDAKDIADKFLTDENEQTNYDPNKKDFEETADNSNVEVSVGEDGNYVVDVKQNINKTIEVPDTWGTVTIDLGKNTIKGDNATDAANPAKPGINFVTDPDKTDKPGTNLIIKNGKVEGGDGSPESPNGAPGIKAPTDASPKPSIDAGPNATIKGGDGATGNDGNGGNGGSGISGGVDVTVEKESNIQGGNGGDGKPGDGKPGDGDQPGGKGGDGGNSIDPTTNTPDIKPGGNTTGGNGGAGGSNGGQGGAGDKGNTNGTAGQTNNGSLDSTTTTVIVKNPTNGLIYKIYYENGKEIDGITDAQVRTGAGEDLTFTGLTPNTWYTVKAYEQDANGTLTQQDFAGDGKIQTKPQSSGGHHSSSTVSKNFTITATAGNGGSISPSGKTTVAEGGSKSFTITVNDGYEIADGASIGTKTSYTFEKVSASHTIEVKFRKVEQVIIVTDPSITGVANWLETDDHVVYLHGYPDRSFRPENPMTRAEAAQMFYNLLLNKDVEKTTFTDVANDAWYATAVETLASIGVIKGVGSDRFAPERAITRAEFAAIATRFAKADDSGSVNFKDVKTGDWFYDAVETAVSYGWINGYTDSTFRPANTITRTEVSAIVNRMLARAGDTAYARMHGDVMKHFTDVNDSFWGYSNIIEATNQHDYTKIDGVESWK